MQHTEHLDQKSKRADWRISVTRSGLPGEMIRRLARVGDIRTWNKERSPDSSELIALASDAAALLCVNGDPVDATFMAACPGLQIIAVASAGYDTIDVQAASERGIAVSHAPGVLDEATADLTFALILAARRRVVEADGFVRRGEWTTNSLSTLVGHDVHSARLGIVGYGAIGRAVARRAEGFGMTVVHHSRTRRDDELATWVPMPELLETSDVVSIHCPLTEQTRGLIGADELRSMKTTATLVNTARGAIVDEPALITALEGGWIHSAGLDVQSREPNSDLNNPLLAHPNCVVLPHIGSASHAARAAMIDLAATNIFAFLRGDGPVTPVLEGAELDVPASSLVEKGGL